MKHIALLLFAAVTLSACTKDNADTIPVGKNLYPAMVVRIDGSLKDTTTFEYDTQNRVTKSINKNDFKGYITTTTISYTYANNLLSEIVNNQLAGTSETVYRSVLNYVNGTLTTIFEYSGSATTTSNRDSLFYSAGNQPNIVKQHNGIEKNILTYDMLGNTRSILYSDNQNNTAEITLSYDTDHRYYSWCIPNPTNIREQFRYCPTQVKKTWKENGVVTYTGTTTYTYTFNTDGFPTKVIVTDVSDGSTDTKTYEITYK